MYIISQGFITKCQIRISMSVNYANYMYHMYSEDSKHS